LIVPVNDLASQFLPGIMNLPFSGNISGQIVSLVDSLLGATIQAVYRCPECGVPTESRVHRVCGEATELVRGQPWITNDTVNALSTLTSAAIGATLWRPDQTTERGGARQGRD